MNITYVFFSLSLSLAPLFFSFISSIGFSGEFCNYEYNECDSNPCLNDGQCTDHVGGFSCKCTRGYTGKRCHIKVSSIFFIYYVLLLLLLILLPNRRFLHLFPPNITYVFRSAKRFDLQCFNIYMCVLMLLFLWSLYLFSVLLFRRCASLFPFYYFPLANFIFLPLNGTKFFQTHSTEAG